MRTIKFRVWDNVDYMSPPFTIQDIQKGNIQMTSDLPVMQFTGLTDKNGKEIYEGDIIKWESSNPFSLGEIRIVSVTYTQAQFWCNGVGNMFGKFGVYLAELLTNERCEVIGNIYEHQNLLK